jgi:tetratricopeptide (TPR) repeat protein
LLIALGEAQRCAGDPTNRGTLLDACRLAHELGDPDRAARAALANQRGIFSQTLTVDWDKVAALEAALQLAGPAPSSARARLLAGLAAELQWEDGERRLDLGREAVATARRFGDATALAHTIGVLWFVSWGLVPSAERAVLAAELDELTARLDDRTLRFLAGIAQCISGSQTGDPERAEQGLARSRRLAEELGQPTLRWWVAWVAGHRLTAAGQLDAAERNAEELRSLGEAAGQPDVFVVTQAVLLVVRMLQGRGDDMVALSDEVLEQYPGARLQGSGITGPGQLFVATRAWGKAESGLRDEAAALLADIRGDGFAAMPTHYLRIAMLSFLSRATAMVEARDAAEDLYGLLLPHRDEMAMAQGGWIGPVTHDLGLLAAVLGRYDEAEEHFADAERFQERALTPASLVHTRLAWGRMLLRRGQADDASRARALLEAAKTGARQVNIPVIEARIDQLLAQL